MQMSIVFIISVLIFFTSTFFTKWLLNNRNSVVAFNMIIGIIPIVAISLEDFQLFPFAMPLLFIVLLLGFNKLMLKIKGRNLIFQIGVMHEMDINDRINSGILDQLFSYIAFMVPFMIGMLILLQTKNG